MGLQRLGVSNPSANTSTLIYTASGPFLASIIATNKHASTTDLISIHIVPSGQDADSTKWAYLAVDQDMVPQNTLETHRFALNQNDKVYVKSTSGITSFMINGLKQVDIALAAGVTSYSNTAPLDTMDGMIWVDKDGNGVATYDNFVIASGGTESTYYDTSGYQYKLHTFTSGTNSLIVTRGGTCEVLVVAGGGGGGLDVGGGGGAGGLIYKENYSLATGSSITATVGAGGAMSTNGGNSVFGTLTAIGGGYGGNYASGNGNSGGSGGGGAGYSAPGYAGAGTSGQGYAGGPQNFGAPTAQLTGSGGGGACGPGQPGVYSISGFAEGGPGFPCSITGTMTVYAKGGRGGGDSWTSHADGAPNTGNGGDGAGNPNTGKTGGSGIILVRYRIS